MMYEALHSKLKIEQDKTLQKKKQKNATTKNKNGGELGAQWAQKTYKAMVLLLPKL